MTRDHRLVLVAAAGCVAAVAAADPLPSGALALGAILVLNYVNMANVIGSAFLRRLARLVPFAVCVFVFPPSAHSPRWWAWPACLGPVVLWQAATWRRIRIRLSLARRRVFPPVPADERAGAIALYGLSGPCQELLHRGVLPAGLVPLLGVATVPITTLTFVAEHVLTSNPNVRRTGRDIAVWTVMSLLFGAVVYIDPAALWCAAVAHTLFNLPNVVQWSLMTVRRPIEVSA
ncbi:MAG TPA: CPBP family glutamic-type intramembrane protease [Streptosporangiaceae bacterium]|jgi:hypothetical protein